MTPDKQLFLDINHHLLHDDIPSEYLMSICNKQGFKKHPFRLLYELQRTQQSPQHHPEGSVWNHTMLVIDEAARVKNESKNADVFMWAALLHDIGKPSTTKIRKGKITSYDHDTVGERLSRDFLNVFLCDEKFIDDVSFLIRYHMQILFIVNNLPFADLQGMKEQTSIEEIALLGLCDRLGRTNANRKKEENNIRVFLQKCREH